MTDNEIIKALEYCKKPLSENTCVECVFYKTGRCSINMLNATLDLINRQKIESNKYRNRVQSQKGEITRLHKKVSELTAEMEELKEKIITDDKLLNDRVQEAVNSVSKANQKYVDALEKAFNDKIVELKTAKSEAIQEFAERLKDNYCFTDRCGKIIPISTVDNLVKEMTEVIKNE